LLLSQISAVFHPVPWEYVPAAAELPIDEINLRSLVLEFEPDNKFAPIAPEQDAEVMP
jgi:hypothetical protein